MVRQVRKLGYDVIRTPGKGRHATVVVPETWAEEDARRLAEHFEPLPNPAREQEP
ncbi:MAG TPA: hypothetical protein VH877_21150 [Polyangia bacterium]|jgi:hypothetical protein|nr:hypothetical protein [Polyangia bacterium]